MTDEQFVRAVAATIPGVSVHSSGVRLSTSLDRFVLASRILHATSGPDQAEQIRRAKHWVEEAMSVGSAAVWLDHEQFVEMMDQAWTVLFTIGVTIDAIAP